MMMADGQMRAVVTGEETAMTEKNQEAEKKQADSKKLFDQRREEIIAEAMSYYPGLTREQILEELEIIGA